MALAPGTNSPVFGREKPDNVLMLFAREKDVDPYCGMQKIGAVILAAGESSRLGQPKQLLEFRGRSLVRQISDAASQAACLPIVVVVGAENEKIRNELAGTQAAIAVNEKWQCGIGSSIRVGVKYSIANSPNLDAIVLLVCDQPFVDATVIARLIALRKKTKKAIIASAYANTLGVPALFDCSCFEELVSMADATGAKALILSKPARVAEIPFPEGNVDIDTWEDYERLTNGPAR